MEFEPWKGDEYIFREVALSSQGAQPTQDVMF